MVGDDAKGVPIREGGCEVLDRDAPLRTDGLGPPEQQPNDGLAGVGGHGLIGLKDGGVKLCLPPDPIDLDLQPGRLDQVGDLPVPHHPPQELQGKLLVSLHDVLGLQIKQAEPRQHPVQADSKPLHLREDPLSVRHPGRSGPRGDLGSRHKALPPVAHVIHELAEPYAISQVNGQVVHLKVVLEDRGLLVRNGVAMELEVPQNVTLAVEAATEHSLDHLRGGLDLALPPEQQWDLIGVLFSHRPVQKLHKQQKLLQERPWPRLGVLRLAAAVRGARGR